MLGCKGVVSGSAFRGFFVGTVAGAANLQDGITFSPFKIGRKTNLSPWFSGMFKDSKNQIYKIPPTTSGYHSGGIGFTITSTPCSWMALWKRLTTPV